MLGRLRATCLAPWLITYMVVRVGLGPTTPALSEQCSNQLSYPTMSRVVYRDTSSLFHICKRFELFIGSDPKHPGQMIWSGWLDSNQRLPVSKTGGIPLTYTLILVGGDGVEPPESFDSRFTVCPAAIYGISTHNENTSLGLH